MDQRPDPLLPGQRQAGRRPAHGQKPLPAGCRGPLPLPEPGRSRSGVVRRGVGLRAPFSARARACRGVRRPPRRRPGPRAGLGGESRRPARAGSRSRSDRGSSRRRGGTLMKWLIITGDDFGMSPGINLGIVEAHHCGILTSASLMVNRPTSEAAAALARDCPVLSLGLHLELDAVAPERVHAELERQVARFVELVGALPTHLDSHHNVHHDPRALPQVLAWPRRRTVPVRGYSEIRHVSKFYGQWGGDAHLEQIGVEGLLRLLDEEVRDGVTELACHPGYVEPGFPSSYAAEREE